MAQWLDAGNASSLYEEGRRAKDAIDGARETLSRAIGCEFGEVLFTGSGTEAANLALIGTALAHEGMRRRILVSAAEHHCVLHTAPILRRLGYSFELVPVDRFGRVTPGVLAERMADDVLLVSIMHANNELGTVNGVPSLASVAHEDGALMHTDAVQTFLTLPTEADALEVDLLSVAGHKVNGPKGVGALCVRGGTQVKPLAVGGGQEREMRAGTENVAAIVGFAAAVEEHFEGVDDHRAAAREAFVDELPPYERTVAAGVETLPGHLHLRFPGISAETLLILLDRAGVAASSGAACSSGSLEPSHVLLACGYTAEESKEGVRFTFGKGTTVEEAREAGRRVATVVGRLRAA